MNLKQIADKNKKENRKIGRMLYDNAVAMHNGAILGIIPLWWKIPKHKEVIKQRGKR